MHMHRPCAEQAGSPYFCLFFKFIGGMNWIEGLGAGRLGALLCSAGGVNTCVKMAVGCISQIWPLKCVLPPLADTLFSRGMWGHV